MLLILFLLKFVFLSIQYSNTVSITYNTMGGSYYSFFTMLNRSKTFVFDLAQDSTFVSTLSKDNILYNETLIICPLNNDDCRISYKINANVTMNYNNNETYLIKSFPMFKLPEYEHKFLDTIGLSYKHRNFKYNFISSISNIINSNNFIITKVNLTSNTGNIIFGDIDSNINSLYNVSCNVNTFYPYWGCKLNTLMITSNNNAINVDVNYYALFQINQTQMWVPYEFFDNVVKPMLIENFIDNGLCKKYRSKYIERYICQCDVLIKMPKVGFVFGNKENSIEIEGKYLFEKYGKECKFIIEGILFDNYKHFIIGSFLLRHFDTYFNYNKSSITFYNNIPFNKYQIINTSHSLTLLKINMYFLLYYTVYLCIYSKYFTIYHYK